MISREDFARIVAAYTERAKNVNWGLEDGSTEDEEVAAALAYAQARMKAMEEVIRRYARHEPHCAFKQSSMDDGPLYECNCGLRELARQALADQGAP